MYYVCFEIKKRNMYSLLCPYYNREFKTIDELIEDILSSGADPNYEVSHNGIGIGENAIDFIQE